MTLSHLETLSLQRELSVFVVFFFFWMCILFFQPVHKKTFTGTSLVVQWLRLQAPNARGPSSIPSQGTRSHMLQLRPGAVKWIKKKKRHVVKMSQLKVLHILFFQY